MQAGMSWVGWIGCSAVRRVLAVGIAAVVAVGAATAVVVVRGERPAGAATAGQVVTVRAVSSTAQTAVLEAWEKQPNQAYKRVYGPVPARVGSAGVGATREGLSRTPAGYFPLTEAFGRAANPGSGVPYRKVDGNDWWVSDTASSRYNTHQRCAPGTCPFDESVSERLATYPVYRYALVIDYNRRPVVRGAGSAFFVHLGNGRPTAGCVAIGEADLLWLLRWLRPSATPHISIGVGSAAIAPVSDPVGGFDTLTAPAPGKIRVTGWARDPDAPGGSIRVHVYADNRGLASLPTVAGTNRFAATLALARGAHSVCVDAINVGAGTANPRLGCRSVTVP